MHWWRRLSFVVVAIAVVATAGCSSFPLGSDPAGTAQSPASADTRTETPPPRGGTDAPPEPSPNTVPADERLVLHKAIEENVTVSMYEETGTPIPNATSAEPVRGEAAASVTYGPQERGEVPVTEFEVDGYVVVSLDDRTIWQGQIKSYEGVTLRVDRDGDAEVVEHFVL